MKLRRAGSVLLFYVLTISLFLVGTYWGSVATTVISQMIPVTRHHIVVIDAGHGGVDGGATSCTGKLESMYNLEIALRLNDLLHLLGVHTKMVRTTDISVYTQGETIAAKKVSDLKERVRIANNTENAILLSIHQNHFTNSQYSGAQVFYAPTDGSNLLAQQMQTAFITALNPGSNRKIKKADGVYLMQNISCPGILVECGFLSNPQEEAKLRDPKYQRNICCVIAGTMSRYLYSS